MLFIIILSTVLLFLINIIGHLHHGKIEYFDDLDYKGEFLRTEIISHIITIAAFYLATQLADNNLNNVITIVLTLALKISVVLVIIKVSALFAPHRVIAHCYYSCRHTSNRYTPGYTTVTLSPSAGGGYSGYAEYTPGHSWSGTCYSTQFRLPNGKHVDLHKNYTMCSDKYGHLTYLGYYPHYKVILFTPMKDQEKAKAAYEAKKKH